MIKLVMKEALVLLLGHAILFTIEILQALIDLE